MHLTWGFPAFLTTAEFVTLLLLAVFVVLILIIGWRKWWASRIPPAELERRRRSHLSEHGKMGDATLLEIRGSLVIYSYDVRGIEYIASQDVSGLEQALPEDPDAAGPVLVKYDARNPANSIVLAEEWSGIRKGVGGIKS